MKLDRNKYLVSRGLKPSNLLLIILTVNVILGILVLVFPKNGISIGDTFKLKFVTYNDLKGNNEPEVAVDLDAILQGVSPSEKLDTIDTILEDTTPSLASEKLDTNDSVKGTIAAVPLHRGIQLPDDPNALKTLIYGIKSESKTKIIRILHYGDSQLEGDRITDYFRNRLQIKYGGEGPGILLPNEPAASSRRSAFVSQSKNFKKKAIYVKKATAPENKYGIGAASYFISGSTNHFVSWDKGPEDTLLNKGTIAKYSGSKQTKAFIRIKNGYSGYERAKKYSHISLLYGNDEYFQVNIQSDNYINDYTIKPSLGFGMKKWNLETSKKLKFTFTNGKFPTIYGVALDGAVGVAVDNFAMRGSSAIGFNKMNRGFYSRQLKHLNVRGIILQYGINVVPNVRSDYGYYKKILIKQLKSIKAANPSISIIVIGPSDMSRNKGGRMVSYSNIPLIRDAMREAALETGCCFWDLYEAMGGENSMVAWVKKGLAQKDYTHFSYKGAKYVGEMLYEALEEQINKKAI